jgi:hypothetical protein
MGGSFYLGWLNPRETSLAIWVLKGKGLRIKASFPFTDYCQEDSQMKKNHRRGTCLRDKTIMILVHAIVVNTSLTNDYQYLMYMSINSGKY